MIAVSTTDSGFNRLSVVTLLSFAITLFTSFSVMIVIVRCGWWTIQQVKLLADITILLYRLKQVVHADM